MLSAISLKYEESWSFSPQLVMSETPDDVSTDGEGSALGCSLVPRKIWGWLDPG